jgi:hypothetical protein
MRRKNKKLKKKNRAHGPWGKKEKPAPTNLREKRKK